MLTFIIRDKKIGSLWSFNFILLINFITDNDHKNREKSTNIRFFVECLANPFAGIEHSGNVYLTGQPTYDNWCTSGYLI